ncbi:MAG: protein kinase domain-containing protein [Planctomycetota bacterium]
MGTNTNCPDEATIRSMLAGSLGAEEEARLGTHLENCQHCQQVFESLAQLDDSMAHYAGETGEKPSRVPETLMNHLAADMQVVVGPESASDGDTSAQKIDLSFLHQSEQGSLGTLGTYEITEVVGQGGMGIVLKGLDGRLNRCVAIKVLAPQLVANTVSRKRFLREAQAAAAVNHEHVVRTYAVDEMDGVPFIVMEYIEGISLDSRIKRDGVLGVREILRIGMQAASGLAAAHAQGLVHRDIKPGNILLENGVERVKITDFGLARVAHEAQLTQTNAVAGTPQYMSPEQAKGKQVDHRSDLFSLGCVLYSMCTGRSPFRAETAIGAIHRVCEDTPRPICEINPDIPEWLAAIIDRLLEKDPDARMQTTDEVAKLLGVYLAHVQQPSQVQPPREQYWRSSAQKKRKWPLVGGAIGVGLISILLGLFGTRGGGFLLPNLQSEGPVEPDVPPEPVSGVDVVPAIDADRDVWKGQWRVASDRSLVVEGKKYHHSVLRLPYRMPREYDLVLEDIERRWGDGRLELAFGIDGRTYTLHIDDNEGDVPKTIRFTVRRSEGVPAVKAVWDGLTLCESGEGKLSQDTWLPLEDGFVYLGDLIMSKTSGLRIGRVRVEPLSGEETPIFDEGSTAVEQELIKRIIYVGGTVGVCEEQSDAASSGAKVRRGLSEIRWIRDIPATDYEIVEIDLRAPAHLDGLCGFLDGLGGLKQVCLRGQSKHSEADLLRLLGLDEADGQDEKGAGPHTIEELDLAFTRIGNSGLARIASLPGLRVLDLAGTRVSDQGIEQLSECKKLQELNLAGTSISPDCCTLLAKFMGLRKLNLDHQMLDAEAVEVLTELPQIRELSLQYADTSDELIPRIAEMPALERVSLVGTALTKAELTALMKAAPQLDVEHSIGTPVDLLARLEEDSLPPGWQLKGGGVVSPKSKNQDHPQIQIPLSAPEAYILEAVFVTPPDNGRSIWFTFPMGVDHYPCIKIDTFPQLGFLSGLTEVDGIRQWDFNEATVLGQTLVDNEPVIMRITVRDRRITAHCCDRLIVDWRGDPNRLSDTPWRTRILNPEEGIFYLGAFHCACHFQKLCLTPIVRTADTLK